jgi:hypothetical protein
VATHVFVSYVRDDATHVDRICETLWAAGVDVWLDRDRIAPGMRWQDAIRHAVRQGAFFMACFSKQYWNRPKTFMNTELGFAIGELSKMRHDQSWFIPVRLDDCEIPDRNIGPGETLCDLQYVDLFRDWPDGMRRILATLTPFAPDAFNAKAKYWVAEERRIDRALRVYDEWHNPLLHQSRIQVSNFLELIREGQIAGLPTLTDFERSQREFGVLSPYADHFFKVIHFFERWALIYADNLLDHALASRLLGSYVRWYDERLMKPLTAREENPDFVSLLKVIDTMTSSNEIQECQLLDTPNTAPQPDGYAAG